MGTDTDWLRPRVGAVKVWGLMLRKTVSLSGAGCIAFYFSVSCRHEALLILCLRHASLSSVCCNVLRNASLSFRLALW